VKTGNFTKEYWIPAGVYPGKNRGRNDIKAILKNLNNFVYFILNYLIFNLKFKICNLQWT